MMMVCQHENNILMEKKKNKISYKALLEFGLSG